MRRDESPSEATTSVPTTLRTVPQRLDATAILHGSTAAMRVRRDGTWHTTTWAEYRHQAHRVGRSLLALGVAPGEGVGIMGFNRPEWFLANLGAITAGAVPAGIYTTNPPELCRYIADHAEAAVVVVERPEYLETFRRLRPSLPHLHTLVVMDPPAQGDLDEGELSWEDFLALGEETGEAEGDDLPGRLQAQLEQRMVSQQPDDCCTLIYTSGTTGPPKAVRICHHNVLWVAGTIAAIFELREDESVLSYLPLSHIAEQVVSLHCPMAVGACSWFAESLEAVRENLLEVRPHFFFAVPRVWEKMQAGIEAAGAGAPPLRRAIARWAREVGTGAGQAAQAGERPPLLYPLARRLVFDKVRRRLGLDRARVLATSTAPISRDTLDFFQSLDMPLLEVYGMSECTGPTTVSTPDRYRLGSVGYAIPGTELKIAEDGEVLMRGPHVFLGYAKDPDATAETLDEEGWLHSGDVGELDDDGFLRITDRKKDLLITSGGKNVAPQVLEAKLREIPVVSQAVVVGDGRKYIAALLTLDPQRLDEELGAAGSPAGSPAEAAACPRLRQRLEGQVATVNQGLARYETIKRFTVLPRELDLEHGELTPTLKVKRRMVYDNWAGEIEDLYNTP